jgi:hypothetical protein
VRDDDHRHALLGELAHHFQHLADHLGVERAGRLVEQHDGGAHRERARDRHALLLAARELRRVLVALVGEAYAREQARGELVRLAAVHAPHAHRPGLDVLGGRHVREEVEALEDHPDLLALARDVAVAVLHEPPAGAAVADRMAVDEDLALVDPLEVVDAADERRLAGAARPDDADDLAPLHVEVDAAQRRDVAVALVHAARLDGRDGGVGRAHRAVPRPAIRGSRHSSSRGLCSTCTPRPRRRSIRAWTSDQQIVIAR